MIVLDLMDGIFVTILVIFAAWGFIEAVMQIIKDNSEGEKVKKQ